MQISTLSIYPLSRNTNNDNLLGIHLSGALHCMNYLGWDHNQQRGKEFDESKKVIVKPHLVSFFVGSQKYSFNLGS